MVVDADALASSLHALLATVDLPPDVPEQEVLRRLGEVLSAATQVLGADAVGLMLLDELDTPRIVGATDDAGAALEAGQLQLSVGPAIDSLRDGRTVLVEDLAKSSAYAALWEWLQTSADGSPPAAASVRAVLSAPVRARGEVVGNLNCISAEPHSWDPAQVRASEAYAGLVGVLLRLGAAGDAPGGDGLAARGERDRRR